MTMNSNWKPRWLGRSEAVMDGSNAPVLPAPYYRKTFKIDRFQQASVRICGLGFYELYLNGSKVGNHVLDPVVTHYDKRVRHVKYDVSAYVVEGLNAIGVVLGNGWYNCHTEDHWDFHKASWRDYPKLAFELAIDDQIIVESDDSWRVSDGPIVFDGLRNGESYDARLELPGWSTAGYDDSSWDFAVQVSPPGGMLEPQIHPPCTVRETIAAVSNWRAGDSSTNFDIGQNITGWARIRVSGAAGTELILRYGERLNDKAVDQSNIDWLIKSGDVQTDRYILKGEGVEVWEPRFTYHGFRYVEVYGDARIESLEARVVNTSFDQVGTFCCSNEQLNTLHDCTVRSYLGNFTGIPTDCPHREKNGWTGDAQIAVETGLFNFDASSSYIQWLDSMADCQRPSGQFPGIVPTAGWGYNWGSGPAWDSAFLIIPWNIYLYTGDETAIRYHYEAMKRYVDYLNSMAKGHVVSFGLGDWCHPDKDKIVAPALTSTSYYYGNARLIARFATLLGRRSDAETYATLSEAILEAFNKTFYRGNGLYAEGEPTAMGCALYQELVEEGERSAVVSRLAETMEAGDGKVKFGLLGAKYIPRVLAENGHEDLAYRILTQPEFPGWMHWLAQGATTLREYWGPGGSDNHIMFGDVSAFMFKTIGGISPDPDAPGFDHFTVRPMPMSDLKWAKVKHRCPKGLISSEWEIKGEDFVLQLTVPEGSRATVILPDCTSIPTGSGQHNYGCRFLSRKE